MKIKSGKLVDGFLVAGSIMFGMVTIASANLVHNGSFESGDFYGNREPGYAMELLGGSTTITDWTVAGNSIAWMFSGAQGGITPSEGSYSLDITGWHDYPPYGGVYQTIDTTEGYTYTLSFDLASIGVIYPVSVSANAGSTVQTFTMSGIKNSWQTFSLNFIAESSHTLINIYGTGVGNEAFFIGLDNVSVEATNAPVPEPATMLLFGTGLAGLVAARRRKKAC